MRGIQMMELIDEKRESRSEEINFWRLRYD